MTKLPSRIRCGMAADISDRVQSYLEQLEQETHDLEQECDVLRTRCDDMRTQCEQLREQRDEAKAKLLAMTALWQTIQTAVVQGEAVACQ